MIVYPNAKINIGLNIINKRTDGFHNIESCFFPIELNDILEIVESDSENTFQSTGIPIPGRSENNLCLKAWHLLNKDFKIPFVKIHLHKQIPIGAGIGGGSADGAFALKTISEIFNLNLSVEQLEKYAAQLGSDCAFFIKNSPAFAEARGEVLSELKIDISGTYLALVNPGIHVGTADAYAGISPKIPKKKLSELILEPIATWQSNVVNDFEAGVCLKHPKIKKVKDNLLESGAIYVAMSGSGSSVFGIFQKKPNKDLAAKFPEMFYWEGNFKT